MSRILQEGKSGDFELKKKIIEKGTILNIYDREKGKILKGQYDFDYPVIVLTENGKVWMSDSQMEVESMSGAVEVARGDALIGGLGIGLLPTFLKDKRKIKSIDIIEKNKDVIDLVFCQIASPRMNIIHSDIFDYLKTTDKKYDFVQVDIWEDMYAPFEEIEQVRDLAKRCLKTDGIIFCWLQELYDNIKDRLPKEPVFPTSEVGIHDPCLICGKTFRNDYVGLCMDCADALGVSELFQRKDE